MHKKLTFTLLAVAFLATGCGKGVGPSGSASALEGNVYSTYTSAVELHFKDGMLITTVGDKVVDKSKYTLNGDQIQVEGRSRNAKPFRLNKDGSIYIDEFNGVYTKK